MIEGVADDCLEHEREKWAGEPGEGCSAGMAAKEKQFGSAEGGLGGVAYLSAKHGRCAQDDAPPRGGRQ